MSSAMVANLPSLLQSVSLPREGDGSYLLEKPYGTETHGVPKKRRKNREDLKQTTISEVQGGAQPDGEEEDGKDGGVDLMSYLTRDLYADSPLLSDGAGGAAGGALASTSVPLPLSSCSHHMSPHSKEPGILDKLAPRNIKHTLASHVATSNAASCTQAIRSYLRILGQQETETELDMAHTVPQRNALPPHLRKKQQKLATGGSPAGANDSVDTPQPLAESAESERKNEAPPAPPLASPQQAQDGVDCVEAKKAPASKGFVICTEPGTSPASGKEPTTKQALISTKAFSSARNEAKGMNAASKALSKARRGWSKGNSKMPPSPQDRSSRWPKREEQRPDPTRWDINWDKSSVDVNSAGAENGLNGTDSQGYELADWSGGWAPAPIDWDARPAFRDKQSVRQIEDWMKNIDEEMCQVADASVPIENVTVENMTYYFANPDAAAPADVNQALQGDPCPRYWVGLTIAHVSHQTFWHDVVLSKEPKPLDEGDLAGAKPFWECYLSAQCLFLAPCLEPEITGIDPDENSRERLARENDNGSNQHAKNRRDAERAKIQAKRDKRERAVGITAKSAMAIKNSHKPLLNIYVRSAHKGDMTQIQDIYNYYVDHSVTTPETTHRTVQDTLDHFTDIETNDLPYLVACERSPMTRKEQKRFMRKHGNSTNVSDRIVGFAYADDFHDIFSMYRFTVELDVFTRKDCLRKGIAKCLLDKLMALLDPQYSERGGFDVIGDELKGLAPSRVIKNILTNVPYDACQPQKIEWVRRFLGADWLGYKQVGHLEGVGDRDGKVINMAIFQRTVGATLVPQNPPLAVDSW